MSLDAHDEVHSIGKISQQDDTIDNYKIFNPLMYITAKIYCKYYPLTNNYCI